MNLRGNTRVRGFGRHEYFKEHASEAVALLGIARSDSSTYARNSAGNAISDISKTHPHLVLAKCEPKKMRPPRQAFLNRARRHLRKSHPFDDKPRVVEGKLVGVNNRI